MQFLKEFRRSVHVICKQTKKKVEDELCDFAIQAAGIHSFQQRHNFEESEDVACTELGV